MMDLSKSYEFFKPEDINCRVHIIGCGSVGSTVAENLARFGITKITLYDFDIVEPHNVANQMFSHSDIGKPKVVAVAENLMSINPDCKKDLVIIGEGYVNQNLSGYVFLCVDSVELRQKIVKANKFNNNIRAMFDFRTRLIDAQHYAANWGVRSDIDNLLKTMDFSHSEAMEATPVSACNVTLSVAPTIRMIVAAGVANFINFVKKRELKHVILIDAFNFTMDAM